MMPTIAVVLGTRPEIIKLYTVIQGLKKYFKVIVIHTGQHYSKELHQNQLDIFNLKIDCQLESFDDNPTVQLSKMISALSLKLTEINPSAVVVHGDTNSTLAGAISATKNNLKLIHIESGARCFDKSVPEEQNRIVADHFAWLNFCYDQESKNNLKKEGLIKNVFQFSNTAYSTCHYINQKYLKKIKQKNDFVLVTLHRAENTDNPIILKTLINLINHMAAYKKIIFPLHPRTKKILHRENLSLHSNIEVMAPQDYLDFLKLIKSCEFILSDSGGVVDESVYFNKPLIIMRNKTERNELLKKKKIKQLNPRFSEKKLTITLNKIIARDLEKMKKVKIHFEANASHQIARLIHLKLKSGLK